MAIHGMINILSLFLSLQVLGFLPVATAFISATNDHRHCQQQQQESPWSSSSTRLKGTLSWSGDAYASIDLNDDKVSQLQGLSLRDWLDDSNASNNLVLLGAEDVEERPNGIILCRQPAVDFLGIVLRPVFWNKISRQTSGTVTVTIIDAQTEVGSGSSGGGRTSNMVGHALRNIMQESKFQGRSIIQAHDNATNNNIRLSVDLKLTLLVTLPPLLWLPPGFNSIGSAIIKRTGKLRSQKLLQDLLQEYHDWVRRKQDETLVDSPHEPTQQTLL
jgi:hypothetical protein